ncbi:LysM domain-containing protein [Methylomonas sp. MgM2]
MFTDTSRYNAIETATLVAPDGRMHSYKRRRFLPNPTNMEVLAEVAVTQGDRLDNITAKALGDPEQFWRICDINNAMHPSELTSQIGRILQIPLPQFEN